VTLLNKVNKDTVLKMYKVVTVPSVL